ncbi:ABC transporter ATP-binding protein [Streptomyces mashuensis]|uniref:ABC transporter ATP-binding protein n=1 Tax=Streptomyces mashuensis TaxID=33904 RepID=A0A919E8I6_9ACTN|nr:ATP-binding cassette domain-containing protein [Streptomyces mashuensis]GHF25256.1 ABC transporter ATP-binding protein [Streptomyces mashuensis]
MRLEGVGHRYRPGGPWVLRDIGLEISAGRLTRVVGGNGSGKSTLLRLLAGIERPARGRVVGRPRTAYVPERFPPALPFTAAGYLTHMGRVHGLRRAAAEKAAHAWLERFGAGRHARTPLSELSKGSCQKVAVAQGLMAAPDLLVLDEAWTGLDPDARAGLDRAVLDRVAAGGAVVFVDHDPRRLAEHTGTAHRLAAGRLTPTPPPACSASVLVEAEAPDGTPLPAGLPPVTAVPDQETRPGTVCLAVAADASDALLRALLSAPQPWHIRAVTPIAPGKETGR